MRKKFVNEIPLTKKEKKIKRFLKILFLFIIIIILLSISIITSYVFMVIKDAPSIDKWMELRPNETTFIYSGDKKILGRLYTENRIIVPLYKISPYLQKAVIVSEDENFYNHPGISIRGIIRAIWNDLLAIKDPNRTIQGGSTITQQVARLLFLSLERTIKRKIQEIYIAFKLEKYYTKQEILEIYLNLIYWGNGAYGAEAAAQTYFGKSAKDLNLEESALLAGILSAPEIYNPYKNIERAKLMRNIVLERLYNKGYISEKEFNKAYNSPIKVISPKKSSYLAPYFFDYVVKELIKRFGKDTVYQGGLKIYTTLDLNLQKIAEESLKKIIQKYGKEYNVSQGALVAIEPSTGYIKAWVGGLDYSKSQFDRVSQAMRQPGSSFKPFVYLTALQRGFKPSDLLEERELSYKFNNKIWKPKNYDNKLHGTVSLEQALKYSYNIATITLLEEVGVGDVIRNAKRMGIESELEPSLALALGTSVVTPLELTRAYTALANGGFRVTPITILRVEDSKGNILLNNEPQIVPVLDRDAVASLVKIMKKVILEGTGVRANIGRPCAGKTGTTDDYRDAWFIGFTPELCVGVWIGNDDYSKTKNVVGGFIPAMIWREFMVNALKDKPVKDFDFLYSPQIYNTFTSPEENQTLSNETTETLTP
ncbi:MAG: penicillin-binding protein 1A [Dictyoglomaceae bacterium]|nr:penicillin-binding protein 1A [Dictyoglomaceae bacterium]